MSDSKVDEFLSSIVESLSPGLQRVIRTLRSPNGRHVCPVADDTTYLPVTKGSDGHWRGDVFSGRLNHGDCIKVATWVSPDGRPIATRPGNSFKGSDNTRLYLF